MTYQTTSIGQVSRGYCLLNRLYYCTTLLARKYGRMNGGCVQELSVADVHRRYQWRMCIGSISGGCVEEKLTKNIEKCNVRKPQNVITLLLMSNSYIPLSRNICSRTGYKKRLIAQIWIKYRYDSISKRATKNVPKFADQNTFTIQIILDISAL